MIYFSFLKNFQINQSIRGSLLQKFLKKSFHDASYILYFSLKQSFSWWKDFKTEAAVAAFALGFLVEAALDISTSNSSALFGFVKLY